MEAKAHSKDYAQGIGGFNHDSACLPSLLYCAKG